MGSRGVIAAKQCRERANFSGINLLGTPQVARYYSSTRITSPFFRHAMAALGEKFHRNGTPPRLQGTGYGLRGHLAAAG